MTANLVDDAAMRQAVLAALRARPDSALMARLLDSLDPDALLAFAERNRVAPIVAHAVLASGSRLEPGPWEAIHATAERRMEILLAQLDLVAARCSREGIRLIALKNAGIARGLYPCPACCPMGDLDLLVERERFREAHAIALQCGFTHASRSKVEPAELEAGIRSGGTEYVKTVDGIEVWIEIQWRPIAGRWIRRDQEPDGAELISRSVPMAGTDARLLSPEDNLIQVALHTAKHSYVRAPGLRLHTDVDRLVAFAPPDWKRVVGIAERLQVKTAVYFSLACARELLGSPIPEQVLAGLAPPAWKQRLVMAWLRKADFFEPDRRKFSRPGMMLFHALLYDDSRGLLASAAGTDPGQLGLRNLPRNIARGLRRTLDLATRYQR